MAGLLDAGFAMQRPVWLWIHEDNAVGEVEIARIFKFDDETVGAIERAILIVSRTRRAEPVLRSDTGAISIRM